MLDSRKAIAVWCDIYQSRSSGDRLSLESHTFHDLRGRLEAYMGEPPSGVTLVVTMVGLAGLQLDVPVGVLVELDAVQVVHES